MPCCCLGSCHRWDPLSCWVHFCCWCPYYCWLNCFYLRSCYCFLAVACIHDVNGITDIPCCCFGVPLLLASMLLLLTLLLLVYRTFQNVACTLAVPPFTGALAVWLLLPAFLLLLALLMLLALLLLLEGLRIRIRIGSGLNRVSGSGFGIRIKEGKIEPQKEKLLMFGSDGWPLLRAEGFFCNLDVLYGGLGIGKLYFLIQKK
jgi:hypothetical protein